MTPVESLHACYVQMTHMQIRLAPFERYFADFISHGYTLEDFQMVLGHLLRMNRRMDGAKFSLRLTSLLDFEYAKFESLRAEAAAMQRNEVKRTPAERVLATRMGGALPTRTGDTSRAAGEVARVALVALRETL